MVIEVRGVAERDEQEGARRGSEEAQGWKRQARRLSATVL